MSSSEKPNPAVLDVVARLHRVSHRLRPVDVEALARGVEALGVAVRLPADPTPAGVTRLIRRVRCGKCKRCRADPLFRHEPIVVERRWEGPPGARRRVERSLGRLGRLRRSPFAQQDAAPDATEPRQHDGAAPARMDARFLHDD